MQAQKGTPGVVVGYDGSEFAVRALDWASDEAHLRHRPLTLCHAWERSYGTAAPAAHRAADGGTGPVDEETPRRVAEQVVEHGVNRARAHLPEGAVLVDLYEGPAADRLLELSAAAELVVVGACGLGEAERAAAAAPGSPARTTPGPLGRGPSAATGAVAYADTVTRAGGPVGSVRRAVAARARCPVIIVPREGTPPPHGPIAVGVDGGCERVLEFACREAAMRHVPLVAVHCWRHDPEIVAASGVYEPTVVRAAAEERVARVIEPWRLRYPDVTIRVSAAEGPSRQELLEAALDAALLVVGAPHSRCGSMTAFLLNHAPCPVAIVRTQEVDP
ncbi:universal stress protein [Thermopolyspora sp. NPDC052614]|uniref:universal stress protein n=1 Tax=Thermopolyspora sp. NPDC052614 TaxID=3155682 RepID=UPI00342C1170